MRISGFLFLVVLSASVSGCAGAVVTARESNHFPPNRVFMGGFFDFKKLSLEPPSRGKEQKPLRVSVETAELKVLNSDISLIPEKIQGVSEAGTKTFDRHLIDSVTEDIKTRIQRYPGFTVVTDGGKSDVVVKATIFQVRFWERELTGVLGDDPDRQKGNLRTAGRGVDVVVNLSIENVAKKESIAAASCRGSYSVASVWYKALIGNPDQVDIASSGYQMLQSDIREAARAAAFGTVSLVASQLSGGRED